MVAQTPLDSGLNCCIICKGMIFMHNCNYSELSTFKIYLSRIIKKMGDRKPTDHDSEKEVQKGPKLTAEEERETQTDSEGLTTAEAQRRFDRDG